MVGGDRALDLRLRRDDNGEAAIGQSAGKLFLKNVGAGAANHPFNLMAHQFLNQSGQMQIQPFF